LFIFEFEKSPQAVNFIIFELEKRTYSLSLSFSKLGNKHKQPIVHFSN
jgi:hypothetical protein